MQAVQRRATWATCNPPISTYRYQEHTTVSADELAVGHGQKPGRWFARPPLAASLAAYARPDALLGSDQRSETNAYSASINLAPFVPGTAADVWTFDAHNYMHYPDPSSIKGSREPFIRAHILIPERFVGTVMKLCLEHRGVNSSFSYPSPGRVEISLETPRPK